MHRLRLIHDRMERRLPLYATDSFTACVTDGPYGDGMNEDWNRETTVEQWSEVRRVLKPGAYCLAFGSPTRSHRMATRMEDAGFEIADTLLWLFNDRMPKARDIGKASGDERWNDYHPRLKQCWEPIIVARKPTPLSYHENAKVHGVAGFNISSGKLKLGRGDRKGEHAGSKRKRKDLEPLQHVDTKQDGYRYPPNIILDQSFACLLDEHTMSTKKWRKGNSNRVAYNFQRWVYRDYKPRVMGGAGPGSLNASLSLPVSRYFYCTKATPAERKEAGYHPCVKPLALMRWLLALVIYPGYNRILDPFCGSGTLAVAARSLELEEPTLKLRGMFIDSDRSCIDTAHCRLRGFTNPSHSKLKCQ